MTPREPSAPTPGDRIDSTLPEANDEPQFASTIGRDPGSSREQVLMRGALIGRYVILERVGAGAMGVVYGAHDPELDRKVALKFLKSGTGDPEARTRLLREAQAMARLTHPNVVTVHDVGTIGDEVFVAMEFVRGVTLRQWLREHPRDWREVVAVFVAAGQGIATAHGCGLVHRDLKPDNIMLGIDERVRVMDFGLARADAGVLGERHGDGWHASAQALELELTGPGALVGTPPYIAPEQWKQEEADARSDQFSFCVAFWEALYDERPFQGSTHASLMMAITTGTPMPPREPQRAPVWLRRLLERGLSVDRAARWPSMSALLQEIAVGSERERWAPVRRWVVGGLASLVIAGAGGVGMWQWSLVQQEIACEQTGVEIDELWNDGTREAMRAAFLGTGVAFAETTADKVIPWIDRQATTWKRARAEGCLNVAIRGTWSDAERGRSLWCLEDRLMEMKAVIDEMRRPDAKTVRGAVVGVANLGLIEACLDSRYLANQPLVFEGGIEQVRDLRADLSQARALGGAGRAAEGLVQATIVRERAQALGWRALSAEARYEEAELLEVTGAHESAATAYSDAYLDALRLGLWDLAVDAATDSIRVLGYSLARPSEGRAWYGHASAVAEHASDPEHLREANRKAHFGLVLVNAESYAEARKFQEDALELRVGALGRENPLIADSLNDLAITHAAVGEQDAAMKLFAEAAEIREKTLGADHPSFGASLNNLAVAAHYAGDNARSVELHRRALDVSERALGRDHTSTAVAAMNLADMLRTTGALAEAQALNERALAIYEREFGHEHPDVARALTLLANVHVEAGSLDKARELYEQACGVMERTLGSTNPDLAVSLNNLAIVEFKAGHLEATIRAAERALAIVGLHEGVQEVEPSAHDYLARALLLLGRERERALAEVELARTGYRALGAMKTAEWEEFEAWLKARTSAAGSGQVKAADVQ